MLEKPLLNEEFSYRRRLIEEITQLEWEMFSTVSNVGGLAACQKSNGTFEVMRKAQHNIWSNDTLESYKTDLMSAAENHLNLMTCKYGYMMAKTFPREYEEIKDQLPNISEEKRELVMTLTLQHNAWTKESAKRYPRMCAYGRPLDDAAAGDSSWPSVENYFFCELLTYSCDTLRLCLRDFEVNTQRGDNPALQILKGIAFHHGYERLEDLEEALLIQQR